MAIRAWLSNSDTPDVHLKGCHQSEKFEPFHCLASEFRMLAYVPTDYVDVVATILVTKLTDQV